MNPARRELGFEDMNPGVPLDPDVAEIYEYWCALAPGRMLPGRQHVAPADIAARLLPTLWLLDVQREPFRLRYRLVGTAIVDAMRGDPTGKWLDEAHPHVKSRAEFFERYQRVVRTGVPSRRRGIAQLWIHADYREIENLILPLASDGTNVDVLLVTTKLFRYAPERRG
ncbi:PAS domain-containing protein [Halotia wernerae UHCC 0503]|jgi:hypothetical protein|nr:PAS domain-containing protein [Halotia wernerae UHCC 0503]